MAGKANPLRSSSCRNVVGCMSLSCKSDPLYLATAACLPATPSPHRYGKLSQHLNSTLRSQMAARRKSIPNAGKPVTLKILAEYLDLSPATVSIVLNNSPVAKSISLATRQRVQAAAKKLDYRPNLHARMLRTRLTNTVGVIVPEVSEGYFTKVMLGVEQYLLQEGSLYFTVRHLCRPDLMEEYPDLLIKRSVDGFLSINTELRHKVALPVVSISSHARLPGVTNVVLDHDRAAKVALRHLYDLGHRRIAFMKGNRYVSDSDTRWEAIVSIAREIGIVVRPELSIHLEKNSWSPDIGYPPVRELLARTRDFTAIFSFNDTAAIGAIRAIEDVGLNCPRDISVIGFDDIIVSEYLSPRLTTVRQPLHQMGTTAAELLVKRIQNPEAPFQDQVWFEPELVVRESTAGVHSAPSSKAKRTKR